jgi:serine/threonine-protein kinase
VSFHEEDLVGRTVLGRYRIVKPLGRGGQGMVYLARGEGAAGFARPTVVKRVLTPFADDPQVLDQFAREARITSQLRHPDIVSVIDFERDGVSYVMVLEYVHGYDMRRWERFVHKKRGGFAPEVVAYVMIRTLEALHYAHTLRAPDGSPRQVIHRDISPANVLVDLDGHIKLTDFGIARMDAEEVTVVTSGMQIKGKLPYVAPEMFRGAPPSVGTDVYACGVMLHELLLGKNEFRAVNALETLALAAEHVATRLDVARTDIPKAFADAVERALCKDPTVRFQSALEFAQALRDSLGSEITEVEARFREVVRADFQNPELAKLLGSPPLSELDAAWRQAEGATGKTNVLSRAQAGRLLADETTAPEYPFATAPTTIESPFAARPRVETTPIAHPVPPPPPPSSKHSLGPWLALAGLGLVAVLIAYVWQAPTDTGTKFVYVQRESTAQGEPDQPGPEKQTPAPEAPARVSQVPEKPAHELTTVEPRVSSEQGRAMRMSAAFAQKRPQVERCFEKHQNDVGSRSSLQVQFTIDKRGRVTNASMVPDALTATQFGKCVLKAATSTQFGPQPNQVVVRIPVTARVLPQ